MRADSPPRRRDAAAAALALRQEGLLRPADLLRLGFGSKAIAYRIRVGRLFVQLPGVLTLGPGPFPRRTAWLAAVWWCGEGAVLSHVSAGALLGHGDEPDVSVVHVTTTRDVQSRPGVVVHRTRHLSPGDVATDGLLLTTSPARTIIDEAAILPFDLWRSRVDRLRRLPAREIEAALALAPYRPGCAAARRLLDVEAGQTKSLLERRFLAFCRRRGVPRPPELNAWVAGHKADAAYRAERLVVELDGRTHHERREQMRTDRDRDSDYQLAAFRILRLTWWDLEPELAATTVGKLRAFLGTPRGDRCSNVEP